MLMPLNPMTLTSMTSLSAQRDIMLVVTTMIYGHRRVLP